MERQPRILTPPLWNLSRAAGWVLFSMLPLAGGCSWFRGNQLEQYRADNERLIGEYRAERDRAEQLAVQNRALVGRVSDLEQRLSTISNALQDPLYQPASQRQPRQDGPSLPGAGDSSAEAATLPPAAADPWRPSGGQ